MFAALVGIAKPTSSLLVSGYMEEYMNAEVNYPTTPRRVGAFGSPSVEEKELKDFCDMSCEPIKAPY